MSNSDDIDKGDRPERKLSFKTRNRDDTKERILQEAIREFSAHGLVGARVERIVKNSDISMRMLYHYYDNKEALYVSVLERVYGDVRAAELQFDARNCAPEKAIGQLIDFTFTHFVQHPELINIVMAENFLGAEYLRRSELIPSMTTKLQESVRWILEEGAATGVFRRNIDPAHLWLTVFSLCWTHLSNRHTLSWMMQTDLSEAAWLDARRKHVHEVVMRFLRP